MKFGELVQYSQEKRLTTELWLLLLKTEQNLKNMTKEYFICNQ